MVNSRVVCTIAKHSQRDLKLFFSTEEKNIDLMLNDNAVMPISSINVWATNRTLGGYRSPL